MPTANQVTEFLVSLGSTSGEVASSLRAHGIKGRQGLSSCCPIANALRSRFNKSELLRAYVSMAMVTIHRPGFVSADVLPIPRACSDFIARFDDSFYEDLIDG